MKPLTKFVEPDWKDFIEHILADARLNFTCGKTKWVCLADACLKAQIAICRQIPYSEYLKTDAWDLKRRLALFLADYACQGCGNKDCELHVHHLTYIRRGNEKVTDLAVLCKDCHGAFHGKGVQTKVEFLIAAVANYFRMPTR